MKCSKGASRISVSAAMLAFCLSRPAALAFQSPTNRRSVLSAAHQKLLVPVQAGHQLQYSNSAYTAAPSSTAGSGTGTGTSTTTGSETEEYLKILEKQRQAKLSQMLYPTFDEEDYRFHVDPDCPLYQTGVLLPSQIKMHQRIVAIGDVHGDISALIKFLVAAKVLAVPQSMEEVLSNPRWVGGDTILVQVGDLLDRGPNELACVRLLASLSKQALQDDGKVVCLLGNHEILNAIGLFHYAEQSGNLEFEMTVGKTLDGPSRFDSNRWRIQYAGNEPSRWASLEPGRGLLCRNTLEHFKVATHIGRTLFVHAGLTKQHLAESYADMAEMNRAATRWILDDAPYNEQVNDIGDFDSVEDVMKSAKARARAQSTSMPRCLGGNADNNGRVSSNGGMASPLWMRDYSEPSDQSPRLQSQLLLNETLETAGHGAMRIVMGHTPQSRINAAIDGKAWRIDVGASRGVAGGTPEVLEIIHGGGDPDGLTDEIHILTVEGERIPGKDRYVQDKDQLSDAYFD